MIEKGFNFNDEPDPKPKQNHNAVETVGRIVACVIALSIGAVAVMLVAKLAVLLF